MAADTGVPYDELPVEVRRENFGWFGDPWPSGICYDDDGRLIAEMRKPFPAGACFYCEEPFRAGDSGKAMPFLSAAGPVIIHVHKECGLRQVAGSLAHIEHRCTCYGGENDRTPGMTLRAEALEVWRRLLSGEVSGEEGPGDG